MNPRSSFATLIATAQSLAAAVNTRDQLHLRPIVVRQSVAARLKSGLGLLRAFLRRLIILIALDLEWGLVDNRRPLKRPVGRIVASKAGFSLRGLDAPRPSPWLNGVGTRFKPVERPARNTPIMIDMTRLYAHFDYLAGIAANPVPKTKRLAFRLARTHQGIIMAPSYHQAIRGCLGTQVGAYFDAMAASIITKSRSRPPPLPPPRRRRPMITIH